MSVRELSSFAAARVAVVSGPSPQGHARSATVAPLSYLQRNTNADIRAVSIARYFALPSSAR